MFRLVLSMYVRVIAKSIADTTHSVIEHTKGVLRLVIITPFRVVAAFYEGVMRGILRLVTYVAGPLYARPFLIKYLMYLAWIAVAIMFVAYTLPHLVSVVGKHEDTTQEDTSALLLISPDDYARVVYIPESLSESDQVLQGRDAYSRSLLLHKMFNINDLLNKKYPSYTLIKACAPRIQSSSQLVVCVADELKDSGYKSYPECVRDMVLAEPVTLFVVNACLAAVTDMDFADTAETTLIRDLNGHVVAVIFNDNLQ